MADNISILSKSQQKKIEQMRSERLNENMPKHIKFINLAASYGQLFSETEEKAGVVITSPELRVVGTGSASQRVDAVTETLITTPVNLVNHVMHCFPVPPRVGQAQAIILSGIKLVIAPEPQTDDGVAMIDFNSAKEILGQAGVTVIWLPVQK